MNYIHGSTDIEIFDPTALSLGKFDGFHTGHRLLMEEMKKKKAEEGLKLVFFTFDMPPNALLEREFPQVLLTNREKRWLLEQNGVDYLVEYPFTEEVRNMEAEDFLAMLVENLSVKCIVVGTDFRFGKDRKGDFRTLRKCGKRLGFEAIILKKKQYREKDISSTRIREKIISGQIDKANQLLGYEYFLIGEVVHGKKIGRTLGIPTVNQTPPKEKLLPPSGVYVSRVLVDGVWYGGITNVGRNPTIAEGISLRVETYIFDFDEDVYGKEIEVRFLKFLRLEIKFDSLDALKEKMQEDLADARAYLEGMIPK